MADEQVISAPGGGAPGGEPASSPAPVSQPVVTPAAVTPAAPVVPAVPAPVAVDSATPLTKTPGESDDAFLSRVHAQQDAAKPKTGDEKSVETPKPEAIKPAEVKPVEAVKPPEAKVDEKPTPAEPQSKIAETIFTNEKLVAALEEAGLKDELADELRTAALGREMLQIAPDLESAKFMRAQAEGFASLDLAATELKPGDVPSTQSFVRKLMEFSYILKEDGTPEMVEVDGPNGKVSVPKTDGTVNTLLDNLGELYIDKQLHDANDMLRWAAAHPDDPRAEKIKELADNKLAAVDIIRQDPDKHVDADIPEAMKAERARLDADKQALAESKQREADQKFETFRSSVVQESDKALNGIIDGWVGQSSLAANPADSEQTKSAKDFLRTSITTKIREGLYQKLTADPMFKAEQEQKGRRGTSALKDLVNTYVRYANRYIFDVAHPILVASGHERVRQSKAREQKIATQEEQSQRESRSGVKPAIPSVPKVDELQVMREVRVELLGKLHRDPTMDELVTRWRERMTQGAVAKSA